MPFNRIFDYSRIRNEANRELLRESFDKCDFDFRRLRPGLDHFGVKKIIVRPTTGWMGSYLPGKKHMLIRWPEPPWITEEGVKAIWVHELFHATDMLELNYKQRCDFFEVTHEGHEAVHGEDYLPTKWAVDPKVPIGHGHAWFDETYKDGVGEDFAECALGAFAPTLARATSYTHKSTPEAIALVKAMWG